MHNQKSISSYISSSCRLFYKESIKTIGWGHFIRAIAGKVLWLTFLCLVGNLIIPIQSILLKNTALLAGLVIAGQIWKSIANHLPPVVDDLVTGEISFKLDSIALNRYIIFLFTCDILLFFVPMYFSSAFYKKQK